MSDKIRWTSGSATHTGTVRRLNEDSCLDLPAAGVWCVADGMGGHDHGDYASQLVVKKLNGGKYELGHRSAVDEVRDHLLSAHDELNKMGASRGNVIGTTAVALIAQRDDVVCLHVGDSRAYLLRDHELQQITVDHTFVEELIRAGELRREDSKNHRSSHILSRAIGQEDPLEVEGGRVALQNGDRYLLCSDGVYNVLEPDKITNVLAKGTAADAAQGLLDEALVGPCPDNLTAVVVDFSW